MKAVAAGDIRKASMLFDRYHVNVYNYLMKVNQNKMLAEDLTQNVFEKMIKYKSSFQGQNSFKGWLFTIVRNANIDHHRKRKYQSIDDSCTEMATCDSDAHRTMEIAEQNKYLMEAISRLPIEEKEILVMTKFEKMKYSEVSKITGLSESAKPIYYEYCKANISHSYVIFMLNRYWSIS